MSFLIRKANEADLNSVSILFQRYLKFYDRSIALSECESFLAERLKNNESHVWLAESTDLKPAGFMQLYPTFSSLDLKKSFILNDLYVESDYRRLGIAEKLLSIAEQFALDERASSISLQTAVQNSKAQALYEKMGWTQDQTFLSYYRDLPGTK